MALQRPATEIEAGPYEVRTLYSPRLSGWGLQVFMALQRHIGGLLYGFLARQSNLPQVLQEKAYPELPLMRSNPRTDLVAPLEADTRELPRQSDPVGRVQAAAEALSSRRPLSPAGRPSAMDYHHAYKSGAVTPSEVAERLVAFLLQRQPDFKWLTAWDATEILRQAAESTRRYRAGAPLSVLDGVPFAVKDSLDALPYPTTEGTTWLADRRSVTHEMPAVTALKGLGSICIGKTAMQEMGQYPYGINARQGIARNPYNPGHACGGSSTGSAGLLAAGVCPITFGTDGGGSIRIPAALCGVVGLMPTHGRIGPTGTVSPNVSVTTAGPMGGCVADVALMYAAICNTDVPEPGSGGPPHLRLPCQLVPAGSRPLEGLRLGIYKPWFEHADPDVVAACRAGVRRLAGLGAQLREDLCIPELEELRVAHVVTITSEIFNGALWAWRDPALRRQYNLDTQVAYMTAERFTCQEYLTAQRIRGRAAVHFARAFEQVDVILTPSTPVTAPAIPAAAEQTGILDMSLTGALIRFAMPANMLGHPAISLPVGVDGQGLPIGLQLMGRPWQEATLLRTAAALEASLAQHQGGGLVPLPPVRAELLEATAAAAAARGME